MVYNYLLYICHTENLNLPAYGIQQTKIVIISDTNAGTIRRQCKYSLAFYLHYLPILYLVCYCDRFSYRIATVANIMSALLGIPLIPISGFIGEFILLPFTSATFHLLLVVICNTLVEDLTIKLIFKYPFKKNFWWLFVANAISVIICAFVPLPKM